MSRSELSAAPQPAVAPGPVIYVDADGCPVKDEVYRVAARHGLDVVLVANSWMRTPGFPVRLEVVEGDFNAADDWIVDHVAAGDIVISGDIPLAARCVALGARVLGPRGRVFTEDSIGEAVATRNLLAHLRETGTIFGGPAPHARSDRSTFLRSLEDTIQAVLRGRPR